MFKGSRFTVLISIMAVIFIGLACLFGFKGCENGARSREKRVENAAEAITVEQSQMVSVLKLMAENVGKGSSVEVAFQENITDKRGKGLVATEEGIQNVITAVHEAYPDYKSNKLFEDMNIAIQKYNENITRQRKAYRSTVADYEYYTEKWPNNSVITMQGYKIKEYEHLADGTSLKVETKSLDSLY